MGRWLGILVVASLALVHVEAAAKGVSKRGKKVHHRIASAKAHKAHKHKKKKISQHDAASLPEETLVVSEDGTYGLDTGGI